MTIVGEVKPADPQDISHSFGHQGGKIGRGLSNEWVLPDPHMSKNHCSISFRNGGFILTDTSSNGVFLNASPERIARGASVPIGDGDRLKLGDYEISVEVDEAAETEEPAGDLDSFAQVLGVGLGEELDPFEIHSQQRAKPAKAPDFDRSYSGGGDKDPLDDLLGQPPGRSRDAEPPLSAGVSRGSIIPPDDDLFDDLLADPNAAGSDDSFASAPPEQDHVPSSQEFFQPPKVTGGHIPDDWDADDLLAEPPGPNPMEPKPTGPIPPEPAAPVAAPPPAVRKPAPEPAPPAAAQKASTPAPGGDAALLQAFLEGAEMTGLDIPEAARVEMMRTVGQTYRDLVSGLVEVLKVRQTIKNEFRLDQTMIRADDNNPLKFTVNVEEALKAMLGNTSRGYLTPRQAVDQGFTDIKAHQIAVMAGMQVALKALLMRFDPKTLESRMQDGSMLGGILSGSKKARHWELFTQLYAEIAKEAEDDFHGLFGREFARAYEEQAKKV
jgi:type VI secretion system protein